ncbi:hypothetical protein C7I55_26605 [Sphingomonas deserti]|uniref:Pectate lyase domain-containing protein n=2 Tax=Allosphingosinicella deserti TaxID=2116704 RepID=A0A2P7QEL1_9SPHN|nr:hypothetical protein C7I55_26605 [Sphingomonas deserti]
MPRICIFRVAGTIVLQSQIKPTAGRLTVAGQTAPGGGIAIRNAPTNLTGSPIFLNAPENIIRHVRIRPGPTSGAKQDTTDAITVDAGATNTIIDHASLSWATDEQFNSTKSSANITVQWSLIYEGLSKSTHVQGEHAKGVFMEGGNLTLHHNLIAHATERLPNAGAGARIDVVNNISYNMREKAHQYFSMIFQGAGVRREANIIGNWVSMGPSSLRGIGIFGADYQEEYSTFPGQAGFYLGWNIDGRRLSDTLDERLFLDPSDWRYVVAAPYPMSMSLYTRAAQAVQDVAALAGAWPRDGADQRVVADFLACRGRIIDDPAEVGGWPSLEAGQPYADGDGDGMADDWEAQQGVGDGAADKDGDGYTNLEEFLNELAGDQDPTGRFLDRIGTGSAPLPPVNCGLPVA